MKFYDVFLMTFWSTGSHRVVEPSKEQYRQLRSIHLNNAISVTGCILGQFVWHL